MKKIVIIGTVWPEPNSTAAGHRMMQLIAVFKKLEYQIIFSSIAAPSEYSFNLLTKLQVLSILISKYLTIEIE